MAIDLVGFSKMDDRTAVQEAASAGLQSMQHLIRTLSNQTPSHTPLDCREISDFTVTKFKHLISVLNRTGHAWFRRGSAKPASDSVHPKPQTTVIAFQTPKSDKDYSTTVSPPVSTTSSFFFPQTQSETAAFPTVKPSHRFLCLRLRLSPLLIALCTR
ncbi:hypothetical protein ACFX2I_019510 [Malus domestica]